MSSCVMATETIRNIRRSEEGSLRPNPIFTYTCYIPCAPSIGMNYTSLYRYLELLALLIATISILVICLFVKISSNVGAFF